jgi:hypothetical protein
MYPARFTLPLNYRIFDRITGCATDGKFTNKIRVTTDYTDGTDREDNNSLSVVSVVKIFP